MFITKMSLPRRTVLRGMGAVIALPLLDAMVPALSVTAKTAANPVRRFGACYMPNGMAMEHWTPKIDGTAFELSPILEPFAPFREQMLVLSGLDGVVGGGDHAGGCVPFLSGVVGRRSESFLEAGITLDQIVARQFREHTQLASLELGLDSRGNAGSCDAGYSCAYTNTISWRTSSMPLAMENNPRVVFEQLFGDVSSTGAAARLASVRKDRSVLDSVAEKVAALERTVGPSDRRKLDEYLDGVRDIERRIQKAEEQSATELPVMDQPVGIPPTFKEHATLMFDLQLLAFQCDLTRVVTFMLGREITGRTYPEIGVPDSHHPLSHHQHDPGRIATFAKVNRYHTTLFAEYVERLRTTPDGDGSLLDHVILMLGAGISDANEHLHTNLPILLVGGGSGRLKGGRHLTFSDVPLANLLVTLADKLDVPVEKIGGSKGRLDLEGLPGV